MHMIDPYNVQIHTLDSLWQELNLSDSAPAPDPAAANPGDGPGDGPGPSGSSGGMDVAIASLLPVDPIDGNEIGTLPTDIDDGDTPAPEDLEASAEGAEAASEDPARESRGNEILSQWLAGEGEHILSYNPENHDSEELPSSLAVEVGSQDYQDEVEADDLFTTPDRKPEIPPKGLGSDPIFPHGQAVDYAVESPPKYVDKSAMPSASATMADDGESDVEVMFVKDKTPPQQLSKEEILTRLQRLKASLKKLGFKRNAYSSICWIYTPRSSLTNLAGTYPSTIFIIYEIDM